MPWVRSHWRCERGSASAGGDFTHAQEIRIVANLIEKGVPREDLSTKYRGLWDEAQQWIADGRPGDKFELPPGAKWITKDSMYELDGKYHFKPGP